MVCKKCGHHSENSYGVCPFCGEVVKKSKSFTAGIIMLTVGICFVIVATVVVCGVVFSSTRKILPREERYEQTGVYNDVSHPVLRAEPLPEADYELRSEPLPESKPKLKSEPNLKSEPIKEETTSVSAEKNKGNKTSGEKKPGFVTFGARLGKVNGKLYAVKNVGSEKNEKGQYTQESDKPVIPKLPVKTEGFVHNFVCYGDYVYYTVTPDYDGIEGMELYRCKTDFTSPELLLKNSDVFDSEYNMIFTYFVIEDGILFSAVYNSDYSDRQYQCLDLNTKKVFYQNRKSYNDIYGISDGYIEIYDNVVFCNEGSSPTYDDVYLYMIKDGEKKMLIDEDDLGDVYFNATYGYVDGYVYYSEDMAGAPLDIAINTQLKRINVFDGSVEVVDECYAGGGSDYFYR